MEEANKENSKKLTPEEELELQKLRMKAKFGSLMGSSGQLSTEAELQWLKQIETFEDALSGDKRVTVKDLLEDIEIKDLEEIPAEYLKKELDDLLERMSSKGIELAVLCDTPALEIYKFIVEELLPYETNDMRGSGYTTHFIYEEFHPNDGYDINHTAEEFILGLCNIEHYDYIKHHLFDEVFDNKGILISQDEVIERILPFGETFDKLKIIDWGEKKLDINEAKTEASFRIFLKYSVHKRDINEKVIFKGNADFEFKKDDLDYWAITRFNIPGFSI